MTGKEGDSKEVLVTRSLLATNQLIADRIRKTCTEKSTVLVNVVSSPGSGKTTLLERIAERMPADSMAVITADIDTDRDKIRIEKKGIKTLQLKTLGACHLEAGIVEQVLPHLTGDSCRYVFIENIGNLICPTEFDLGEHIRILLLSTPEGDDKVMKYPLAFQSSNVLVINKTDLLPYVPFDIDRAAGEAAQLNPSLKTFTVSALSGEGVDDLVEYLTRSAAPCTK